MKKLSFLELEKEMDALSEEEAFKTKAGGQPQYPGTDCYFQSMDYIYKEMGFDSQVTVDGLEGKFDDRYGTTENPHPSSDGVKITRAGSFAALYADNNFNGINVSSANGANLLPETTNNSNEYIAIIKNGSGEGHAVAFDHYNAQSDTYTFWDEQNDDWVTKSSSDVIGVIKFHEDENTAPSTTMPTSVPPTSPMPN